LSTIRSSTNARQEAVTAQPFLDRSAFGGGQLATRPGDADPHADWANGALAQRGAN
jgi:hypothetical protein